MKLNRTDKQTLFAIFVVIALITILGSLRQSNYQPKEITIAPKNENSLFNAIDKLISNSHLRKLLQKKSLKNFYLSNEFISRKLDICREKIIIS